jgi:hypothetical protein
MSTLQKLLPKANKAIGWVFAVVPHIIPRFIIKFDKYPISVLATWPKVHRNNNSNDGKYLLCSGGFG